MLADKLSAALDTYRPPQGVRVSHPIEYLYKRGTLSTELYIAAQAFRSDYETACGLSSAPIINWASFEQMAMTDNPDLRGGRHRAAKHVTRVPSGPRPLVDSRATLIRLRWTIGGFGFQLLRGVCGLGVPIAAIATLVGVHRDIISFRLREGLHDAAEFYEVGDALRQDG